MQKLPYDPLLHKKRGDVLLNLGRWEFAIEAYNTTIDSIALIAEPLIAAQIYANKGEALWKISKFEDALLAFNAAIERDPDNVELWQYRGEISSGLGYIEDAKESYKRAIVLKPDNPYLHKEYGDALLKFGCFLEARQEYDEAISLELDFGYAYKGRSQVFNAMAQEAYEEYSQLMKRARKMKLNLNDFRLILVSEVLREPHASLTEEGFYATGGTM